MANSTFLQMTCIKRPPVDSRRTSGALGFRSYAEVVERQTRWF